MSEKQPQKMSKLALFLIVLISLWFAYEFLTYDLKCWFRKYKLDKIINKVYNKGVELCHQLIEIKSEN